MTAASLDAAYEALRSGHWTAALRCAQDALADGEAAEARHAIGVAMCGIGNLEAALESFLIASRLEPGVARWARAAAAVQGRLGQWPEVLQTLGPGLAQHDPSALMLYLVAAVETGSAARAVADVRSRETDLLEADSSVILAYGRALAAAGHTAAALEVATRGLAGRSDDPLLHELAAQQLEALGRPAEALPHWQSRAALSPRSAFAQMRLALALLDRGRCDESRAARLAAEDAGVTRMADHSCGLYLMLSDPEITPEAFLNAAQRTFEPRPAPGTTSRRRRRAPSPAGGRRLRIGYLSAEFRSTPSFYFTSTFLRAHDRAAFEVILYNTSTEDDGATAAYAQLAEGWRHAGHVPPDVLRDWIAGDRLDVLVDLSGHFPHNRLALLTEHLAPVQASYPHFPATTGCPGIDYLITDRFTSPHDSDSEYSESLWRLEPGYLAFSIPADAPPLGPPRFPAPTFGIFQRLAKFTPDFLDVVARVLVATPESRLVVHNSDPELDRAESATSRWLRQQFCDRGVDHTRLLLRGPLGRHDHLALAGAVDVALDTFPYGGQTTTCESLWMGVPVVSMVQRTHVSRVCAGLLTRIGRPDWVARTPAEYVEVAQRLVAASRLRPDERGLLREAVVASGLTDGRAVAAGLEDAYRRWAHEH